MVDPISTPQISLFEWWSGWVLHPGP